jgi:hypothetical protein
VSQLLFFAQHIEADRIKFVNRINFRQNCTIAHKLYLSDMENIPALSCDCAFRHFPEIYPHRDDAQNGQVRGWTPRFWPDWNAGTERNNAS